MHDQVRGIKRKRDTPTRVDPVDNWSGPSEGGEPPFESKEGEIGRYEPNQILHGHANAVGEGLSQSELNCAIPVSSHIKEETRPWLGLRYATSDQSDGTGSSPTPMQTDPLQPASCHVAGPITVAGREEPVPLGVGHTHLRSPVTTQPSLANEANN